MKGRDKPLSETNPYLRDPKLRGKLILVAAATSSAIEGIRGIRGTGYSNSPQSNEPRPKYRTRTGFVTKQKWAPWG